MNTRKHNYKKIDELAHSLGLTGSNGQYKTKDGLHVDLTASAETKEAILYHIGKATLTP